MEDLRGAFRTLCSAPGFALTAVLSLSVGIGGTVSMFTVVNSVLLKPLALPNPGKLVRVMNRYTAAYASSRMDREAPGLLSREFIRWRKQIKSLDSISITALACRACTLTGTGRPERLSAMAVSAEYFDTLGVQAQLGRWFREFEEQRGGPGVVILSDAFWRRNFAAKTDIVGQNIHINGAPYEVVGVTPSTFRGDVLHDALGVPDRIDIYLPLRFTPQQLESDLADDFVGIARLKPDVTLEQAGAELDSTLTSIPEYQASFSALKVRVRLQELQSVVVGEVHQGLLLLLLSMGLVLLIACVNVANLSLVRSTQRARELALRAALGATRRDLIRRSLMESILIALAGTITGFILSQWITEFAVSRAPHLPRSGDIATDAAVLSFAIGICALTTMLFGALPAWQTSRADPLVALNAGSRGNTDTLRGGRIRSVLIATEVALGVVLVIGSGLLLRSLHQVMNAPRGFDGHDVMIADLYLPSPGYQRIDRQISFFRRLRDELISMPGVLNVSANTRAPIDQEAIYTVFEENSAKPLNELIAAGFQNVTPEYFSMMKIRLRAGRFFRDSGETEQVVVISESAAQRMWPGQNPLGKRIRKSNEPIDDYSRVVGVVGDILSSALDRTRTPVVYRPYSQRGGRNTAVTLVIQTALPASLAVPLRQAVLRLDPDVPVGEPRSMTDVIANSVQARVFQAWLLSAFALVAVFLAAIGIYSVLSYSIIQRRKEIGIRIALGADRKDVSRFVFENGMTPVVAGLAIGLAAASFFARLLASLLFQVGTLDPTTFVVTPLILILTAALPCILLARKASRFDPMDALRLE
ncbi:MAG TPA: ABC transporter permease [Bryobacteraceae bacterium]|nr:ABC transporter permease [Bryobacteraceae bacterium]